jgi:BirA family biotin operon repressor/biotin-[acetyl-CoA-carboxylase] ligase
MPIDPNQLSPEALEARLAPLLRDGNASVQSLAMHPSDLRALGFHVEGDRVFLSDQLERLQVDAIQAALSDRAKEWIVDLEAYDVVGSTNTLLGELADKDAAHGAVRLAELQVQGRGRHGRSWQSPYGQNLALSLGVRLPMAPDELGGLSLCVGMAVADALRTVGVHGAALKWPNDVLVDGRKIAGILVEIHRAGTQTDVIVGVGINFRLAEALRQQIGQPVIDLEELGGGFSRNEVAGRLISSLVDFADGFAVSGFGPMRQAFDRLHWFHNRTCTLLIGEQRIVGRVRGVTDSGELALEIDGQVRTYNAGEVSLRAG